MNADRAKLEQEGLTEAIIGAFYAVYNELGAGFLENVYENALNIALKELGLPVRQQTGIDVYFRNRVVGEYRADLLIPGRVIIEVKSTSMLTNTHEAQLLNYLKATGIPVGLLLNFGPRPQFKRRVLSERPIRVHPRKSAANNNV